MPRVAQVDPAVAWQMRNGEYPKTPGKVWSREEVRRFFGVKSGSAVSNAVERYERRRHAVSPDPWQAYLPWQVRPELKDEYIYRMLVLELKDRHGERLNEHDRSRLALFRERINQLGVVLVYDEDADTFAFRRRRPDDDDLWAAA